MLRLAKQCIALVLIALPIWSSRAQAEDYPSRVITLVVPFAAGGPSDVIARLVAQSMSQSLKQQIVIENVAGAGGTVAAARVARSAPDGYTLLIHHLALAAAASLYNLPYETKTDFEPIGLINTGPMVLVGRKTLVANTASELVDYLKNGADKITMAHAGVGSNGYLCALLLSQAIGTKPVYVPYNGTGPAMNDLLSGQVDVLCDQTTNAVPQILGGTVKGYIVTSAEPLNVIKDVATVKAANLPTLEMSIWHGIYAPKGTAPEVVAKLNQALAIALSQPFVAARFQDVGTSLFPKDEWSPTAHQKRFLVEIDRWKTALQAAGVSPANVR